MLCLRKEVERRFERDTDSNCPPGKRFITSEGSSVGSGCGDWGDSEVKTLRPSTQSKVSTVSGFQGNRALKPEEAVNP